MRIDVEKLKVIAERLGDVVGGTATKYSSCEASVTIGYIDGTWFRLTALDEAEAAERDVKLLDKYACFLPE